jgi:hypothetical protein
MAQFIETKVRCKEIQDSGKEKTVTNTYLIDALSFTEAEARATEEVVPYLKGDFEINAVKKSNIAEIVENENDPDEDGRWFDFKVNYIIIIDKKTGEEKRKASHTLVKAPDLHTALRRFDNHMRITSADFEIAAITETPILDVFKANSPDGHGTANCHRH